MNSEHTPNSDKINIRGELTDYIGEVIAHAAQAATRVSLEGGSAHNPHTEWLPRDIWNATYDNTILTIEEALPKVRGLSALPSFARLLFMTE